MIVQLLAVWLVGLLINLVTAVGTTIFVCYVVSRLSNEDTIEVTKYYLEQNAYVKKHNSERKILLSQLVFLIPVYSACTNLVYVFNVVISPDSHGIIKGCIEVDNLAIIRLIKFS